VAAVAVVEDQRRIEPARVRAYQGDILVSRVRGEGAHRRSMDELSSWTVEAVITF
jgi:hypothetical protein